MKKLVVVVKDMKQFILSCLCALAAVVLSADETAKKPVAAVSVEKPAAAVPAKEPIRVACVGDSITYGHGASNRAKTSYPAQLQTLLGDEWSVVNFGHNARTALDDGKEWNGKGGMGYRKSPEFAKALASKPDIVVFMLGTNDSKPVNWDGKSDDVKRDYAKLVDDFLALDPKPVVVIGASPFVKKDSFSIRESEAWAFETLYELGIRYDSSVFPAMLTTDTRTAVFSWPSIRAASMLLSLLRICLFSFMTMSSRARFPPVYAGAAKRMPLRAFSSQA